jgi:hypothetical protein
MRQHQLPICIEAERGPGAAHGLKEGEEVLAAEPTRDHRTRFFAPRRGKMPVKTSRQPPPAIEEAPGRRSSNRINTGLYQPAQEKVRNLWLC